MNILLLSPVFKPFLPFLSSPQGDASSTLAVFSPLKASLPTLALGLRERDFKRFPGFPPSCLQRRRTPPPPSSFPQLENRVCVLIRFPDIPFCQRTLILPFAPSLYPFSLFFPFFSSFPLFLFFFSLLCRGTLGHPRSNGVSFRARTHTRRRDQNRSRGGSTPNKMALWQHTLLSDLTST